MIVTAAQRVREFDAAGSYSDGADYREWRADFEAQFSALLRPLARHCQVPAWEYRRKLGLVSAASSDDVPRLVELLQQECGFEVADRRLYHGGYFGSTEPDGLRRGVFRPYYPADDNVSLVELIGAFLAPWRRPVHRFSAPDFTDLTRLVECVDTFAADGFARGWWDGPDLCYAAGDPVALPLLATWGLDHFPTLEEAQQLALREIDAPEVQFAELTQPYLMRCRGVVLFLFPQPGPTAEQLAHSAAKIREAVGLALAERERLDITGEARPADVWRLLRCQGERILLCRGDVDAGHVTYLRDRPICITLRESYDHPEAEAEELLLLLGFALCAGPEQGFDYEALEAAGTKERLTRPVALAFGKAFRTGEEPQC